ncbi:MAG: hypothetical protein ACQERN_00255 [Thermodesulfobacteriota bacterium]
MKQKYTILKDNQTDALTIQEYAELSKDLFSLICEESYDGKTVASAVKQDKKILIDTLRTPNLYPISAYIDKIADTVVDLYEKDQEQTGPVELVVDDVDLFKTPEPPEEAAADESVEIEDLLEDDAEEEEGGEEDEQS